MGLSARRAMSPDRFCNFVKRAFAAFRCRSSTSSRSCRTFSKRLCRAWKQPESVRPSRRLALAVEYAGGDMETIRDQIIEIIRVASKPRKPDLSDETKSLFDVGLDSLDYASTIMELEEKYNLQIVEEDMDKLVSLKDMVTFVESRVGKS